MVFYTLTSLFQNASIDDDDDWADFGGFEVKHPLSKSQIIYAIRLYCCRSSDPFPYVTNDCFFLKKNSTGWAPDFRSTDPGPLIP